MIEKILSKVRKYKDFIMGCGAIIGVFFGVAGIWLSFTQIGIMREESFQKFRPFINIEDLTFAKSKNEMQIALKNVGASATKTLMVGFAKSSSSTETETVPFKLGVSDNFGTDLQIKDENDTYAITVLGFVGDINPQQKRNLKIKFPSEKRFENIKNGSSSLILEIIYNGLGKEIQHVYYLNFDENNQIYVSNELENVGEVRSINAMGNIVIYKIPGT